MTFKRLLCPIETTQLYTGAAELPVKYFGYLDEDVLRSSFETLCARYPALRAEITTKSGEHIATVKEKANPIEIIDHDFHEVNACLEELAKRHGHSHDGAHLTVFRGQEQGFVFLIIPHWIVDAMSLISIIQDFWKIYTETINGRNVPVQLGGFPTEPTQLLRERWSDVEDTGITSAMGPFERNSDGSFLTCDGVVKRDDLTREETTGLIAAARSAGIKLQYLISAVAAASLKTILNEIRIQTHMSLRNHVTPHVGATETTYFAANHLASYDLQDHPEPFSFANEIQSQIKDDIGERKVHLLTLDTPHAVAFQKIPTSEIDLWVRNAGSISLPHPNNVKLETDMQIPVGYKKTVLSPYQIIPITSAGQMQLYYLWRTSTEDAIDEISSTLRRIAREQY